MPKFPNLSALPTLQLLVFWILLRGNKGLAILVTNDDGIDSEGMV